MKSPPAVTVTLAPVYAWFTLWTSALAFWVALTAAPYVFPSALALATLFDLERMVTSSPAERTALFWTYTSTSASTSAVALEPVLAMRAPPDDDALALVTIDVLREPSAL